MAQNKPTFAFIKMFGCFHCVQFFEKHWPALVRDAELQQRVNFVLHEWGVEVDPATKKMTRHELPKNLSFVNYGPYFYLHAPSDSTEAPLYGKEFKAGEGGYQRNPVDMKRWILDNIKADPKLSQAVVTPPPQVTQVNFPRATPQVARAAPQQQTQVVTSPAPQQAYFPPQVATPQRAQVASPKEVKAAAPEVPPARYIARNRRR